MGHRAPQAPDQARLNVMADRVDAYWASRRLRPRKARRHRPALSLGRAFSSLPAGVGVNNFRHDRGDEPGRDKSAYRHGRGHQDNCGFPRPDRPRAKWRRPDRSRGLRLPRLRDGIIIAPRLIATVEHVVDGASVTRIKRGGEVLSRATIIGADPARDLALLWEVASDPAFEQRTSDGAGSVTGSCRVRHVRGRVPLGVPGRSVSLAGS